jgi:hypothetical protein
MDLVTAILTNTTVQTVRFHDCAKPKAWSSKQVRLFFTAIARLPKLRWLSIAQTTVTLQALTIVVEKQLKELDIWGSELCGTDRDATVIADALRHSQSLRALYLKRVTFPPQMDCLDPLIAAGLEALVVLVVEEARWKPGAVSDQVFRLLQSSRLTQLVIYMLSLLEECHMSKPWRKDFSKAR